MDSRHLIGQAQGILMERYGVDVAGAFAVLRRYSQDNNVKLPAVAERIVSTREIPDTWADAAAEDPATAMGSVRG